MFLKHCFHVVISLTAFVSVVITCGYLGTFLSRQNHPVIIKIIESESKLDKPEPENKKWSDIVWPLLWNLSNIYFFIISHSFLATGKVKSFFDRIGLEVVQRSIYVLISCLVLNLLMLQWNVVTTKPLWLIDTLSNDVYWWIFGIIHGLAWTLMFGSCILMDFNELLGIKQVYYSFKGLAKPILYKSADLQRLYSHMRHPSFVCFLVLFWIHPHMTLDRLLLGFVLTIYMMSCFKIDSRDYLYQKEQYIRKREYGWIRNG